MRNIEYLLNPTSYKNPFEYIAILNDISDEQSLFEQLKLKLNFPNYFGENWNAVSDCLRDFHWVEQKGIVILHDSIDKLSHYELEVYLDVIRFAIYDWKGDESHYLKVVFKETDRKLIEPFFE